MDVTNSREDAILSVASRDRRRYTRMLAITAAAFIVATILGLSSLLIVLDRLSVTEQADARIERVAATLHCEWTLQAEFNDAHHDTLDALQQGDINLFMQTQARIDRIAAAQRAVSRDGHPCPKVP